MLETIELRSTLESNHLKYKRRHFNIHSPVAYNDWHSIRNALPSIRFTFTTFLFLSLMFSRQNRCVSRASTLVAYLHGMFNIRWSVTFFDANNHNAHIFNITTLFSIFFVTNLFGQFAERSTIFSSSRTCILGTRDVVPIDDVMRNCYRHPWIVQSQTSKRVDLSPYSISHFMLWSTDCVKHWEVLITGFLL